MYFFIFLLFSPDKVICHLLFDFFYAADPFAGVDLLGGMDPQPAVSTESSRPAIDLDALYSNMPTASHTGMPGMQYPGIAPMQQPQFPIGQTSVVGGGMGGYGLGGFGMSPGLGTTVQGTMGASGNSIGGAIGGNEAVKLGKQVKKEDPFKDLLG